VRALHKSPNLVVAVETTVSADSVAAAPSEDDKPRPSNAGSGCEGREGDTVASSATTNPLVPFNGVGLLEEDDDDASSVAAI